MLVNAFNSSTTFAFPPTGFTTQWWVDAWNSDGRVAVAGHLGDGRPRARRRIALVLGTMAAFAVQRYRFFGREDGESACGAAHHAARHRHRHRAERDLHLRPLGITLGLATVIVGHATFCIVIVFNNTQARLRRLGASLEDASADLGASTWQTFRYVTFPMMRGALRRRRDTGVRAVSFDEIVVTTFTAGPTVQTLPIWIFGNLFRPNQAPVINVVAAALDAWCAVIPVWLAQRFGGDPATTRV